jgi:trimeric autotransporter adhesin
MRKLVQRQLMKVLLMALMLTGMNSWGQGSENFTNIPTATSSSYSTRTWTGTNGVTWTSTASRTDQTLTGKAICTNGNGTVTSPTYSGGMGTLQFNYVRGFTGTGTRSIEVYVNNTKIGSTIAVSTTSNTPQAYSAAINVSGNVILELRTSSGNQIIIDDISWTGYTSAPILAITGTPTDHGAVCTGTAASAVTYTITNTGSTASNVTVISNNSEFVVSNLSSATIATNGTATYKVTFTPSATGGSAKSATITVASTTSGSNSPTSSLTGTRIAAQAVSSSAASSIGTTAATLNGNVTTLGQCPATTEKGFVYSLTSANANPQANGSGVTKTSVANVATGAFTLGLTELAPSTGYSFNSYVFDGTNYAYGTVRSFITAGPSATLAGTLNESTLNNATFTITLSGTTFVDAGSFTGTGFALVNAPAGVSVANVTRNSDTEAIVTLVYDDTDFDTNASMSITIPASHVVSNAAINSGNITVSRVAESFTASGTLSIGGVCINTETSSSFTFTGTSLKAGDITIGAVTGFTYSSTSGGEYTSTLTIPNATAGNLAATTVFVKFAPTAVQTYGASGFPISGGAATASKAVTASGVNSAAALSTASVTTFTTTSATMGGTISAQGCSVVTERGVVYGITTTPSIGGGGVIKLASGAGTGTFTVNASGLQDNKLYYVRAYAINSGGTVYGTQVTFTTSSLVAPVATAATYLATEGAGFTANWDAVEGATGYELEVSTTNTFSGTQTAASDAFEALTTSSTIWQNITTKWNNNNSLPITGNRSLRISAGSAQETNYIYTQPTPYSLATGTTTWRFNVKTDYDPSTNNKFYFYLTSNNTNLGTSSSANGYVVGVNFSGSDDKIKLWKSTSGSADGTALITSTQSVTGGTIYGIEVTRTKEGLWTLKYQTGGGFTSMTSVGTATDTEYTATTYSGLVSFTSSSNNTGLRFDDFSITAEFSNNISGYNPFTVTGGSVTSKEVTGLTAGATYYYRVKAVGANSTSGISNVITAKAKRQNVWNGTAWTLGTPPTAMDKAIIQNNYNTATNGELTAGQLEVNNGTFTIAEGDNVTITNKVVVDNDLVGGVITGDSFMVIENNANLIQKYDVDNSGYITVNKKSAPMFRLDYALWSSPVAGETLIGFSPMTNTTRFYHYNPLSDAYATLPGTTEFGEGESYLIRVANNQPAYIEPLEGQPEPAGTQWAGFYTGVPNNGNVNVTVTPTGPGVDGYNAVGNPYPSPINIHAFYDANIDSIDQASALYFWRKKNEAGTGSYAKVTKLAYTANTTNDFGNAAGTAFNGAPDTWVINPGQGFIVQATGAAVYFNNEMRVPVNNNQQFRSAQDEEAAISRLWLNMTGTQGEFSQTAIGYTDETTLDLDYGWDGKAFVNDGSSMLFSLAGEATLGIQARPSFDAADEVPIGYKTDLAGTFTIALDHMDGVFAQDQDIFLRDNVLGITHDLKEGAYEFATEAGLITGRFDVVYAAPLGTDKPVTDVNNVIVYKQGNSISINSGNVDMTAVSVYDMRGRLLYSGKDIHATETLISGLQAEKQVLIVNISTSKGEVSKKIVF